MIIGVAMRPIAALWLAAPPIIVASCDLERVD